MHSLRQISRGVIPQDRTAKIAYFAWIFFVIGLFLYSFTQVDLSLTLTRTSFWQPIQNSFQWIGYFSRPLSSYLFVGLLLGMFTVYVFILSLVKKNILRFTNILSLVIFTAILLAVAYNAFSYDFFNYIFDAKIITNYHENPYLRKALDYPGDPMLSFMRWTHRVYPYGPGWLLLTVPLSFLGNQIFLVTFFIFKTAIALCFLGTALFLSKIAEKIGQEKTYVLAFFALNPLVIIESLVSAHNDIVMLFFAVVSLWFCIQKKWLVAGIVLLFSVSIKFATVLLLPVYLLLIVFIRQGRQIPWEKILFVMIFLMFVAIIAASIRTTFQPWYVLYPLPFMALLARRSYISYPVIMLTLGSLFQYVPFLYLGNWDPPVPMILQAMMSIVSIASLVLFFVLFFLHRNHAIQHR